MAQVNIRATKCFLYPKLSIPASSLTIVNPSGSLSLTEGYPTITATMIHPDEISSINDAFLSGDLRDIEYAFNIDLYTSSGVNAVAPADILIKSIISASSLKVTRITPKETREGYQANITLIPSMAFDLILYPSVYKNVVRKEFKISDAIKAICAGCNTNRVSKELPTINFKYFFNFNDIVCVVPLLFISTTYLDMIKTVGSYYGLSTMIGFDGTIRVFSPLAVQQTVETGGKKFSQWIGKQSTESIDFTFDNTQSM